MRARTIDFGAPAGASLRRLLVVAACGWSGSWTLSDALSRLETGNNGLKAQSQRVVAAGETRKAALGNFLPVVKLESSVMRLDRDIELDLDPIRAGIIELQAGDAVNF